jgi:hypothetical protein
MSKGQSRRSVASSVHHRQEAEVATAEERERAAAETAATAARAARLAMVKLAAARAEVEAAAATDAARAAMVEVKAQCASSTDNSVSADDDRDNELKLAREAAQEQAAQWAVLTSADTSAAAAQTGVDVPAVGLTEIAAFTGGAVLPPQTGTLVTMGSTPLSGTSVPAVSGLPSSRPTTSSEPR